MKKENLENLMKKSLGQEQKMPARFKAELRARLDAEIKAAKHIDESHAVHAAAEDSAINHKGMIAELKEFFWGNSLRSFALMGSGGLIAVIIFVAVLAPRFLNIDIFNPETKPAELKVNATALSENGIGLDSSFVLASDENISLRELRENISISPKIAFEVTSENGEFILVPEENLDVDTTYEVTLAKGTKIGGQKLEEEVTWVFRTEPKFAVTGFTPSGISSGEIPVNTALEIEFNYSDIDLESFKSNFFISPAIDIASYELTGKKIVIKPANALTPGTYYTMMVDREVKRSNGEMLQQVYSSSFYLEPTATTGSNQLPYVSLASMNGTTLNILPANKKVLVSIYKDNGRYGKMQVNIYKIKNETLEQAVFEIAKRPYFKLPANYLELATSFEQQVVANDNVVLFPDAEENAIYFYEVRYEHAISTMYFAHVSDLGYLLDTTNETILSYFTADGKLIENGSAKIFYIDEKGNYQSKDATISGLTKISKNGIQEVIGGYYKREGQILPVIATSGNFEGGDDFNVFEISTEQSAVANNHLLYYFKYDKPIYKNGDQVNFKTTFRSSNDFVDFSGIDLSGSSYEVYINNQLVQQQNIIDYNKDFSYLSGSFYLPQNFDNIVGLVAEIRIIRSGKVIARNSINVLAYTKPETNVTIELDTQHIYLPAEEMQIKVKATDTADNPLAGRTVKLMIYSSEAGRLLWADTAPVNIYSLSGADVPIFERSATLNTAGEAIIKFNAPAPSSLQDVQALYITASVDNISAVEKRAFVSKGDVNIFAKPETSLLYVGQTTQLHVKSATMESLAAVANVKANLQIERVWTETVFVGEYYNPETKTFEKQFSTNERKEIVWKKDVTTDTKGNAQESLSFDKTGTYYLIATHKDSKGRSVSHRGYAFYISQPIGDQEFSIISLTPDKASYQEGDTIRLDATFSQGMIKNQQAVLILYKDKSYQTELFTVDSAQKQFSFKADTTLTPYARAVVITTDTYKTLAELAQTNLPEIYLGLRQVKIATSSFAIERKDVKLNVSLDGNKVTYAPGEQVKLTAKVSDVSGKGIESANLTVRVFDKSLLQLSHGGLPYSNNLYQSIYGSYRPEFTEFAFPISMMSGAGDGGGGGPAGIRSDFKEVALFSRELTTNSNGEAEIKFTLPDNITSWVIDVESMTTDMKVGAKVSELRVSQDVVLNYHLPANLHQGDKLILPVYIYNYSANTISAKLQAEASTGMSIGEFDPALSIASNNSVSKMLPITVDAKAPNAGKITVKVTSDSGELLDGMVNTLPIYSLGTPTSTTQNILLDGEKGTAEFEINGDVSQSSASLQLSTSLVDLALNPSTATVASVPDMLASSNHNLALYKHYDRYSDKIIVSKDTLRSQLELTMQALLKLQSENGGFSWFGYDAVDLETSALLAATIGGANDSGIYIDSARQAKLADYLASVVVDANSDPNPVTSLEDKVIAARGLAWLGDERALGYASLLKEQVIAAKSPLALSLLADTYLRLGSNGDARDLALLLSKLAKGKNTYAYFEDTASAYKISSHEHFVTTMALEVIHDTKVNASLEARLTNWVTNNWYQTEYKLQQSQIFATLIDMDAEASNDSVKAILLKVNGKEVFAGDIEESKQVLLTDLQPGKNIIQIENLHTSLYASLQVTTVGTTQLAQSDYKVTTEFIPLHTGKASNTLTAGQFVRLRVSVTPQSDSAQFTARAYLPTGMRAVNWSPGFEGAYYDWYQQIAGQKNISTYGQYLNDYVVFSGWQGKRGQASVFEILLVADSKGTFSTNGTLVYHSGIAEISGYEAGKVLEIR